MPAPSQFGSDFAAACGAARDADGAVLVWVHLDY